MLSFPVLHGEYGLGSSNSGYRRMASRRMRRWMVLAVSVCLAAASAIVVLAGNARAGAVTGVRNPSFETGWSARTPATCWRLGAVGGGRARLSATTSAHSGTYAAKLTVTSLAASANRKVVIDQRVSACAPSVTPGHDYTLRAWYRSNTPSRLSVYYRDGSGWHYWTRSGRFAARSSWGIMSFTTSSVPSGADALSFGPSIATSGWLVVDDVSMAPRVVVHVATAAQLTAALSAAAPGQTIVLADGVYRGNFTLQASGTSSSIIRVTGSRKAILDGGTVASGYVLHLDNAHYVQVDGMTIRDGQKAVVLDQSTHDTLTNLDLQDTGEEIVLLRNFSSDNVVSSNQVHDSGHTTAGYGEGIYVGLSYSNWSSGQSRTGGAPDTSDRNQILGNHVYDTTAENVDIKEGTSGGLIADNSFDATGISGANYADSWVDIAGNGYTIRGNVGTNPGSKLVDGYQTHVIISGWGKNNVFVANSCTVNSTGYGINIQTSGSGNVVYASNTESGAARGLTNIPVTP